MNETMTILPSDLEIKDWAREQARQVLSTSASFQALPVHEQKDIYLSMVQENIDRRKKALGLSKPMATDSGEEMGFKGYTPDFTGDTQAFNDLVGSVDFPQFVADLLKAVFDANMSVMKKQTDSYIKLMKECLKSTSDFIKQVKDDDTYGRLVEKHSDKYNLDKETTTAPDGTKTDKLILTNVDNEKVDMEEAEVKKDMLEAKIEMAKEHRAALREVLLMGVTRLVVEKGEIDAAVEFKIHATRNSLAHHDDTNTNTVAIDASYGGGLMGDIFGGPSGSMNMTNTNIQVNTSDKTATDDLTAKLTGHVNIKFKTDYFKLDNFANMYSDGGTATLKPPAGGAQNTAVQAAGQQK